MIRKALRLIKRLLSKIIRRIPFLRRYKDKIKGQQAPVYLHHKYDVRELLMQEYETTGFNRYDMIVRLLAIECEKGLNDFGWDYYRRMQSARMGEAWVEPAVERFKLLIASYDEKGYDSESEIELDNSLRLIDGSHRMAMALYYHLSMINAKVSPVREPVFYGIEWFHINGFSNRECEVLQNKFQTIIGGEGNFPLFICTLWHPVRAYFDEITEHLKLFGTVREVKDLTLSEWDYRFYTKGIYYVDDIEDWKVEKKLEYMTAEKSSEYQLRMVALEISNPDFRLKGSTNGTLSKKCEHIKRLIRDAYKDKINNYFYDIIMHIGDNFHQNEYIYRLMTMPPIDVNTILQHMQPYNYVITKTDTPYMPADFPVHYPLGKDIDIVCADEEEYKKVLESVKKDVYLYNDTYDIIFVEKKDENGKVYRTLVRLEQKGYLVFLFDIACRTGRLSLAFSSELCKERVAKGYYFVPVASKEILVRIDEIVKNPDKLHHIKYVREHLEEVNNNLCIRYLDNKAIRVFEKIKEDIEKHRTAWGGGMPS